MRKLGKGDLTSASPTDGTCMVVDFILELIAVALTSLEQLFDHRKHPGGGRIRKSLERRKARRSDNPKR